MIKYIVGVLIVMIIGYSCNPKSHTKEQNLDGGSFITDTLKSSINKIAREGFSTAKIYAIRITKLHQSTVVGIEPVYYNDYLTEYGNSADAYLYDGSLFLFYCGIEAVGSFSSSHKDEVRNQFDNFCSKYGIGTKENRVYDNPPIFLKVQGSSLIPYDKGNEREFYDSYFEVEEVKPSFSPDKSPGDSL